MCFFFFANPEKKKNTVFFPWKSLQGTNSRKKKSHFENDWRLCTQATQVYFIKIQNDLERQCVQLMTCSDERKWYFYDKKFWGPRLTSLNFVRKLIGAIKLGGIIAARRVAFRYQFVQKVCLSVITFGDFLAPRFVMTSKTRARSGKKKNCDDSWFQRVFFLKLFRIGKNNLWLMYIQTISSYHWIAARTIAINPFWKFTNDDFFFFFQNVVFWFLFFFFPGKV